MKMPQIEGFMYDTWFHTSIETWYLWVLPKNSHFSEIHHMKQRETSILCFESYTGMYTIIFIQGYQLDAIKIVAYPKKRDSCIEH